jgi:hypothetical protein
MGGCVAQNESIPSSDTNNSTILRELVTARRRQVRALRRAVAAQTRDEVMTALHDEESIIRQRLNVLQVNRQFLSFIDSSVSMFQITI